MEPTLPTEPPPRYDAQQTWSETSALPVGPEPPIEDPQYQGNAIAAVVTTAKRILFDPKNFFSSLHEERSATSAVIWALTIMCLSQLLALLVGLVIFQLFPQPDYSEMFRELFEQFNIDADIDSLMPLIDPSSPGFFLARVITIPVTTIMSFFVSVLIYYLAAYIWKSFKPRFSTFIRVYAFAQTPIIFGWVPYLNIIFVVWSMVLFGMGLVYCGKSTPGRAVGTVLTPLVFCCACACAAMVVAIAIGGIAASG